MSKCIIDKIMDVVEDTELDNRLLSKAFIAVAIGASAVLAGGIYYQHKLDREFDAIEKKYEHKPAAPVTP